MSDKEETSVAVSDYRCPPLRLILDEIDDNDWDTKEQEIPIPKGKIIRWYRKESVDEMQKIVMGFTRVITPMLKIARTINKVDIREIYLLKLLLTYEMMKGNALQPRILRKACWLSFYREYFREDIRFRNAKFVPGRKKKVCRQYTLIVYNRNV